MTGLGVVINLASTLTSASGFHSIFSGANQIQMFILLPFLTSYAPQEIVGFLTEIGWAFVSFDFTNPQRQEPIASIVDYFSREQTHSYLFLIGFEDGSSFVNLIQTV